MNDGDDGGGPTGGGLEDGVAARAEAEAAAAAAIEAETREPDSTPPGTCPFLRLEDAGVLARPRGLPDADHRCAALPVVVPVSERQQALVCLQRAHDVCPRYLRGMLVVPTSEPASADRRLPRATVAASGILLLSLAVALGFVVANGGIAAPIATGGSPAPSASPSEQAAASSSPSATPAASPSPVASTSAVPGSSASPGPSPTPTASAGPSPIFTSTPIATSDRYALLAPCPDKPDCYIYTVRQGDNLTSIGLYFGVPFQTILQLNPWITDPTTIRQGDRIVLPPPTR